MKVRPSGNVKETLPILDPAQQRKNRFAPARQVRLPCHALGYHACPRLFSPPRQLSRSFRLFPGKATVAPAPEFRSCRSTVNTAGVDHDTDQSAMGVDLARVRQIFETNLFGAWGVAQAQAWRRRRRGAGPGARHARAALGRHRQRRQRIGQPGRDGRPPAEPKRVGGRAEPAEPPAGGRARRWWDPLSTASARARVAADMGGSGGRPVSDGAAGAVRPTARAPRADRRNRRRSSPGRRPAGRSAPSRAARAPW